MALIASQKIEQSKNKKKKSDSKAEPKIFPFEKAQNKNCNALNYYFQIEGTIILH